MSIDLNQLNKAILDNKRQIASLQKQQKDVLKGYTVEIILKKMTKGN